MSPEVQLRLGVPSDLIAIVTLERDTEFAPHWSPPTYAAILGGSGPAQHCLIVAHVDDALAGFAVVLRHPGPDRVAELESVVVAAPRRRAGIGRALCLATLDWCRSLGAVEIVLEVRAAGTGAIALYTALGFTRAGRRPRYYRDPGDDALLMSLKLQSTSRPED